MGVVNGVGFSEFPTQGPLLGQRVEVCFRFDTANRVGGVCVRDDYAEPFVAIFRLEDGRHVLASECQYTY